MKYWYDKDKIGIRKYAHIIMLVLNEEGIKKLIKYVPVEDKKYIKIFEEELVYMNKDFRFRRIISKEQEEKFMIN